MVDVIEKARMLVEEAKKATSGVQLDDARRLLSVAKSISILWSLAPREAKARAKSLIEESITLLEAGSLALESLNKACTLLSHSIASIVVGLNVSGDYCPDPTEARVLVEAVKALAPVPWLVKPLLGAGASSVEEVYSNALRLARVWSTLVETVEVLGRALSGLARHGLEARKVLSLIESKRAETLDDFISWLRSLARGLMESSTLLDSVAKAIDKASALASGNHRTVAVRVLEVLVGRLIEVEARSITLLSLGQCDRAITELHKALSMLREFESRVSKLALKLGVRVEDPYKALVEVSSKLTSLSPGAREVMTRLLLDGSLDIASLGSLASDAIKLCSEKLASCIISL